MSTTNVTFYVQIEPEWERYTNGSMRLTGAKAVRVTQRQPDPPRDGADVVRLTLRIPVSRLLPMAPDPIDVPDLPAAITAYVSGGPS